MAVRLKVKESPISLRLEDRIPRGSGPGGVKSWLNHQDCLYILWWWSQGWTNTRIAEGVPCCASTVRKVQVELIEDLDFLFKLPIMFQVGPRQYECQFCTQIRSVRVRCMRHILSHFFPIEWAETAPVEKVVFL